MMKLAFFCALPLAIATPLAAQPAANCAVGTYRLNDGSIVDVTPSSAGRMRWRRSDGTTGLLAHSDGSDASQWTSTLGRTGRPDGRRIRFDCAARRMSFDGLRGSSVDLEVRNVRFRVDGATLAGRLIMPPGAGKMPVVVLVHGAEHDSALDSYPLQRLFPAAGIGAFVYDKRGTGASGGHYTQDYSILASDAVAALKEARRLAGTRAGRIGYQAGSQGGWVAPLAANIKPVDFVVVSFGLAVSPLAAERESIEHEVRAHVAGPQGAKAAGEFAEAIERVAASNFREGFDRLAAVKKRYGGEPWFKQVGGEFARFLLDTPPEELREKGPALIKGIRVNYDPMPVLRSLDTPQLWLLGGKDRDAAPWETRRRLSQLACAGRPISLVVYPNAEHGMYEFETGPGGERLSTRQPESYFKLMRDFILKGRIFAREAPDGDVLRCRGQS
jgi:pimeloyl-ACP methyl ester carboxylesterase